MLQIPKPPPSASVQNMITGKTQVLDFANLQSLLLASLANLCKKSVFEAHTCIQGLLFACVGLGAECRQRGQGAGQVTTAQRNVKRGIWVEFKEAKCSGSGSRGSQKVGAWVLSGFFTESPKCIVLYLTPWDLVVMEGYWLLSQISGMSQENLPLWCSTEQKMKAKFRCLERCRLQCPGVSPVCPGPVWFSLFTALLTLVCGCWGLGQREFYHRVSATAWVSLPFSFPCKISKTNSQNLPVPDRLNDLQAASENLKNAHECSGQGFVGQLVCLVCPWRFLKGLQQDTEPSLPLNSPSAADSHIPVSWFQLYTQSWVLAWLWAWQLLRCCDTCPSPVENTAVSLQVWPNLPAGTSSPSATCWCPLLLLCWSVMMIFWQSLIEETGLQFRAQRECSRNLSLLILLSVLILGTLPHSTLVGESCQKWWCHHHQAHLTLAADCQCWVQVNKSPGTWIHSGVLLQCRHSMIPQ